MSFIDLFSAQAGIYAGARPTYPASLFEYVAGLCPAHERAWDCATGNGQAAQGLAPYFKHVWATDASERQLEKARDAENISYRLSPAEKSNLPDNSTDLVTVATALHWFPMREFYAEVNRVLKPGGLIAVWAYFNATISPEVDEVMLEFHEKALGGYWAPQIEHIRNGYKNIDFPFEELEHPDFEVREEWDMLQWLRFVLSWSAVQTRLERTTRNPVEDLYPKLLKAWGKQEDLKTVVWPLSMRIGRKK